MMPRPLEVIIEQCECEKVEAYFKIIVIFIGRQPTKLVQKWAAFVLKNFDPYQK